MYFYIYLFTTILIANSTPTVLLVPGLGDTCIFPQLLKVQNLIKDQTHYPCLCLQGAYNGLLASYITGFEIQAESLCLQYKIDPRINGDVIIVGISQGSLLARYLIESCYAETKKIIKYISVGGPQMGVNVIPLCNYPIICFPLNFIVNAIATLKIFQYNIGPTGFYHDPKNDYNYKNTFLAKLNNEGDVINQIKKERMEQLEGIMLIKFSQDQIVQPRESQWFEYLDKNGQLIKFEDTNLYQKDLIGLKSLNEKGRIKFLEINRDHLRISSIEIKENLIPFMME